MRPPRRPGERVADVVIFGPLLASVILAAAGHDTTSTCIRSTWRRWVLAYLAVHCAATWAWDPLQRLDRHGLRPRA